MTGVVLFWGFRSEQFALAYRDMEQMVELRNEQLRHLEAALARATPAFLLHFDRIEGGEKQFC